MKFAEPFWLMAGLAVLVGMLLLYRRFDSRQRAALAEFASSHLLEKLTSSFSPTRRLIKRSFFLGALACAFLALARPQWGFHWEEEKERGIDILFAIDTSKSMLTQDVTPDRLTRAKLATVDFVRKLEGDRVGLIAFAGEAFLQAPLTLDYDAFEESLDAIDTGTIPRGGTDISSAIEEAQSAFGQSKQNKKILVLITDGEDLEAQGIDSARAAAKDGMVIYTVGVGSSTGGLIPVPNANGGTDFVKDDSGAYVKSHLDESTLKQIAGVTGGIYEPLGQQGEGLQAIYDKALASMPKQELASKREKVFEERYQWPLAAGLGLLLVSVLIGTRRRDSKPRVLPKKAPAARALALMAMVLIPAAAHASITGAKRAYKNGDYATAEKQYEQAADKDPALAQLQFNVGAAAYKNSEYDKALPAFKKALGTDDVAIQQQAYYNIGNTQFRRGQKTVKQSPQKTIKTWQDAVGAYDSALKLKPEDRDAKFNRDLVQKKLDKLMKENPPKQDPKNDKDQKNNKDQQNKDQQNQNQQDQKQDQQNRSGSKNDPQNNAQNGQQNQDQQGGQQDQKQQNGQDQAQNSNQDQQKKDQPNGQQKTAGNQDQKQPQQGGKPDEQKDSNGKDQQQQAAQNDQKPGGQQGQVSTADKDKGKEPSGGEEAESAPPGQLTKAEAKELLDSLKGGEHALPVTADARTGNAKPQDRGPLKDW